MLSKLMVEQEVGASSWLCTDLGMCSHCCSEFLILEDPHLSPCAFAACAMAKLGRITCAKAYGSGAGGVDWCNKPLVILRYVSVCGF